MIKQITIMCSEDLFDFIETELLFKVELNEYPNFYKIILKDENTNNSRIYKLTKEHNKIYIVTV